MYKAILLPIDLAHDSSWKKSVPVARQLAETFGAKLHAITVVQDIRNAVVSQYFPKDYEETLARDAAEKLSALVAAELPGIEVTEHIAIGQVYREIVQAAEKNGCDLIVTGTHGRRGVNRMILGSQAIKVLHHSEIPVLVVR